MGLLSGGVSSACSSCCACSGLYVGPGGKSGSSCGGTIASIPCSHHMGAVMGSLTSSKTFCLKSVTVRWSSM